MLKRHDLETYLDHFNNKRFDDVISYFSDDVEVYYFRKWTTEPQEPQKVLRGRGAFKANYERIAEHCDEKLRLGVFLAREGALFVELYTSFTAYHDTDILLSGFLKKGETLYVNHFINYALNEKDQFETIKIAQCQTLGRGIAAVYTVI